MIKVLNRIHPFHFLGSSWHLSICAPFHHQCLQCRVLSVVHTLCLTPNPSTNQLIVVDYIIIYYNPYWYELHMFLVLHYFSSTMYVTLCVFWVYRPNKSFVLVFVLVCPHLGASSMLFYVFSGKLHLNSFPIMNSWGFIYLFSNTFEF